jgi:hypothetical protein
VETRDNRNSVLAENLATWGHYLRSRRLIRLTITIVFLITWLGVFRLNIGNGLWFAIAFCLAFPVAILIASGIMDWLLRRQQDHAYKSLETCRAGFIQNLASNVPADLKAGALAIGDAIGIINECVIEFDEREKYRDLWAASIIFGVAAVAIVFLLSGRGLPIHDVSRRIMSAGALVLVIAVYAATWPRVRPELRAFDAVRVSWFGEIANALETLKNSSVHVGPHVRENVQINAAEPALGLHAENCRNLDSDSSNAPIPLTKFW